MVELRYSLRHAGRDRLPSQRQSPKPTSPAAKTTFPRCCCSTLFFDSSRVFPVHLISDAQRSALIRYPHNGTRSDLQQETSRPYSSAPPHRERAPLTITNCSWRSPLRSRAGAVDLRLSQRHVHREQQSAATQDHAPSLSAIASRSESVSTSLRLRPAASPRATATGVTKLARHPYLESCCRPLGQNSRHPRISSARRITTHPTHACLTTAASSSSRQAARQAL